MIHYYWSCLDITICVVQGKALMWWSLLWPLLSKAIVKGKPEQCLNLDHCQIQIRQEFWTWIILFWPIVFLGGKCSKVKRSFNTVNMYIKKNKKNLLVDRLIQEFPCSNFKSKTATTRRLNSSFSSVLSTYSIIIPWCRANSTSIITAGTYLIMNCDVASIELHIMAQHDKQRRSDRLGQG